MITISRREYEVLTDSALIWACMEPTIREIQGKSFDIKSKAYKRLETGLRSLLLFQVLYGHTGNGVAEFFCLSNLLKNDSVWYEMRHGIRFFGDYTLLNFIDEMEGVYNQLKAQIENGGPEQPEDIEAVGNTALQAAIKRLDKRLSEIMPISVKLIGTYIRRHPQEFINIEES